MRPLERPRLHGHALERGAKAPAPRHGFVAPRGEQQLDGLFEARARVGRVDAEVAVRAAQDAAPHHELDAAFREHVEGGVVLGGPHGIERAEQRHAGAEADALCALRDRRQHDGRRGEDIVAEVVLAERDEVEAEPLRRDAELDELALARGRGRAHAAGRVGEVVAQDQQARAHQRSARGRPGSGDGLDAKKRQISSAALTSWFVGPSRRGISSCGCGALCPPFSTA